MGNDVRWWKDRDEWMPGPLDDPTPHHDADEEQQIADADIGDRANDSSADLDDSELPRREGDE